MVEHEAVNGRRGRMVATFGADGRGAALGFRQRGISLIACDVAFRRPFCRRFSGGAGRVAVLHVDLGGCHKLNALPFEPFEHGNDEFTDIIAKNAPPLWTTGDHLFVDRCPFLPKNFRNPVSALESHLRARGRFMAFNGSVGLAWTAAMRRGWT